MKLSQINSHFDNLLLAIRENSNSFELLSDSCITEEGDLSIFSETFEFDPGFPERYRKEDLLSIQQLLYSIMQALGILNNSYDPEKQGYSLQIKVIDNKTQEEVNE